MNWKGCRRKWQWPNFKILSHQFPGGTEKNHEKTRNSQSSGRYLNPGLPENEIGVLATRSGIIKTHGAHSRSEMVAVLRTPCAIPARNNSDYGHLSYNTA
jgi:hypothetical protein